MMQFDVTEIQLAAITIFAATGLLGQHIWSVPVFGFPIRFISRVFFRSIFSILKDISHTPHSPFPSSSIGRATSSWRRRMGREWTAPPSPTRPLSRPLAPLPPSSSLVVKWRTGRGFIQGSLINVVHISTASNFKPPNHDGATDHGVYGQNHKQTDYRFNDKVRIDDMGFDTLSVTCYVS